MSSNRLSAYEIVHRSMLQVVRFCGGISNCGRLIKAARTRVSYWVNHIGAKIPFEFALLMAWITNISIERLSPFTKEANKLVTRLLAQEKLRFIDMELSKILIGEQVYLKQNGPIIVATDGVLILGLEQLEKHKVSGSKMVPVKMLDLDALLLQEQSVTNTNIGLSIIGQMAIARCLEKLIGNRQGQRKSSQKNSGSKESQAYHFLVGRTDQIIAKVAGFKSKDTYRRVKHVFDHGIPALIYALDDEKISIAKAAKIASLSNSEQLDYMQSHYGYSDLPDNLLDFNFGPII